MGKQLRRILYAFIASVIFHVIAVFTGLGGIVIEPVVLAVSVQFPDLPPHDWGFFVLLGSSIFCFAVVFWTIATIYKILIEIIGRFRTETF